MFYGIIKKTVYLHFGGSMMTYHEIVDKVRDVFEYADARNIFEHIAIQVNIVGEGAGVMYIEVAERQISVEPYDYYDRDGLVTIDSSVIMDIVEKKYTVKDAFRRGLLTYQGNERKLLACLNSIEIH
jgi:hypothetical protein